jgi:hypothetical protein
LSFEVPLGNALVDELTRGLFHRWEVAACNMGVKPVLLLCRKGNGHKPDFSTKSEPLQNVLSRIAPAFLPAALFVERGLRLNRGRVGDFAHLSGAAYAAPLADKAPCAEQVRLHVEPVVAVQVLCQVAAAQGEAS